MQNSKKYLVTSALPYINNIPHLGNFIPLLRSDIFVRILKLQGRDVLYICGTDESGTRTEIEAQKQNLSEEEYCKIMHKKFKEIIDWFDIDVDFFGRTSSQSNHQLTKEIFLDLYKQGFIFEKQLQILYCPNCRRYLPDSYVSGICPFCKSKDAKGDQCDKCSKFIHPTELINPKCKICGSKPIIKKDKHLFLDLPKFSKKLEKYINENKNFKAIERNLPLAWIKKGLEPRCISRNLKWGIKIPLSGYENKVFYVWFDAPIGYIAATKDFCDKNDLDYKDYWQNKNTDIIHFMGKDNVPFHTIIWPAELMANKKYNLPSRIYSNEFLNFEGGKFSKSLNKGIFCNDKIIKKYYPDIWRFYLSSILPESKDSDFEWNDLKEKINNSLIANYGNFEYRIMSVANKFGEIKPISFDKLTNNEKKIIDKIQIIINDYFKCAWDGNLKDALNSALSISDIGNKYFQKNKAWELINSDDKKNKLEHILFFSFVILLNCTILLHPFIPKKTKQILSIFIDDFKINKSMKERKILMINNNINAKKTKPLFKKIE